MSLSECMLNSESSLLQQVSYMDAGILTRENNEHERVGAVVFALALEVLLVGLFSWVGAVVAAVVVHSFQIEDFHVSDTIGLRSSVVQLDGTARGAR